MKKITVRVPDEVAKKLEEHALIYGMSQTSAAEFFVAQGVAFHQLKTLVAEIGEEVIFRVALLLTKGNFTDKEIDAARARADEVVSKLMEVV